MSKLQRDFNYRHSSLNQRCCMRSFIYIWIITTALILSGCGNDSSTNANITPTAKSLAELGECTTSKEGSVAWIESENKGYICSMGIWVFDAQVTSPNSKSTSTQLSSITDARDGQVYKTVVFEGATWLAQNLNYAITNTGEISSKCYLNDLTNCISNGRLYSAAAAKLPNICPEGFEVVDEYAWKWLKSHYESKTLKTTEGWAYWNEAINPTNATGLALGPSGFCTNYNECNALGYEGRFWAINSESEENKFIAIYYNTNEINDSLVSKVSMDHNAIRCVSQNIGLCSLENQNETKTLLGVNYYCDGQQWWNSKAKIANIYDYPSNSLFFNPAINYGTITDSRDGQTYRTTTIGTHVWMAENLNYVTTEGVGSSCYNNIPQNCNVGGRLYTWATAMGLSEEYNETSAKALIATPHRGICPEGWHIPSTEFSEFNGINGSAFKTINGWTNKGSDEYGFSAIPAASPEYLTSLIWTTNESSPSDSPPFTLHNGNDSGIHFAGVGKKSSMYSVRCVKD